MRKRETVGKKGSRAILRLAATGVLTAALLTGCGAAVNEGKSAAYMADTVPVESNSMAEYGYATGSMETTAEPMEGAVETVEVSAQRKLIKTVSMSVETKEFDAMMSAVENRLLSLGGYIESSDIYNGSSYSGYRSSRNASMVLRVPQDRLEEFLKEVSDIGNVTRRSDSVEDVTLAYVDLESHRDALRTEQTRLLELLEKAESLEDVLTIEERLTSVRYQLESMESQLRTMDNQVNFSTVYLDVAEVRELTPVAEEGIRQRIAGGFMESLSDIAEGAEELFVWFIVNLPHLVIWAVVLLLVIFGVRKCRRRRKARRAAEAAGDAKASDKPGTVCGAQSESGNSEGAKASDIKIEKIEE